MNIRDLKVFGKWHASFESPSLKLDKNQKKNNLNLNHHFICQRKPYDTSKTNFKGYCSCLSSYKFI